VRIGRRDFREVWAVDFEFGAAPGEPPAPRCMVARELGSGRTLRLWEDDLRALRRAPFATDKDALFVAYYASAELGCFLVLGWPFPANVLDLFTEFRNATNGSPTPCGSGLLGALAYYGLDSIEAAEKDSMRELALRGGPYTDTERSELLEYCESDVRALGKLLAKMETGLDLPRALLRGRYMAAAARIENIGVPIDLQLLQHLRVIWPRITRRLIERIDADYGVYQDGRFKSDRWAAWLEHNGIPWPRLASGKLALDDDTFREMARSYPQVAPIRELRVSLSQLRLENLAVGADGRNRCLLSAFQSKTGRNQPSNAKFIFGPAVWLRGLIQPDPGWSVAYVDWSQQEFGIAAALSGDPAMLEAYESGDPYLAFAKQAGAVPPDATKATHGPIRDRYKACVLAVQYGMGADSLAARIGQPPVAARDLLHKHHETYPKFWAWSQAAVDHAMLRSSLHTAFGWAIHVGPKVNPRSLANFPCQANGAEMLRLACIRATESGILVCAPVHDALLIEAPTWQVQDAVRKTQRAMADASAAVLDEFQLRTDAKIYTWPNRYIDERGQQMWDTVQGILTELSESERPVTGRNTYPLHGVTPVQSYLSIHTEYPHEQNRPSSATAARYPFTQTQTLSTATAAQVGATVPQGADSMGLAVQGQFAARQDNDRCGSAVVLGRVGERLDGARVPRRSPRDGDLPSNGKSTAGRAGASRVSERRTETGSLPGGDDIGLPDPVNDPEGWEFWNERAGILQFDAGLSREEAERAALAELVSRRQEGDFVGVVQNGRESV
jgi:hypothetical protein